MDQQTVSIGRIVIYVSRTGNYSLPAIVTVTRDSLYQPGVDGGFIPDLTDHNIHLTVFTAGKPGKRAKASDFVGERKDFPISENVAGCYQEWDVPYSETGEAGTWHWPERK